MIDLNLKMERFSDFSIFFVLVCFQGKKRIKCVQELSLNKVLFVQLSSLCIHLHIYLIAGDKKISE